MRQKDGKFHKLNPKSGARAPLAVLNERKSIKLASLHIEVDRKTWNSFKELRSCFIKKTPTQLGWMNFKFSHLTTQWRRWTTWHSSKGRPRCSRRREILFVEYIRSSMNQLFNVKIVNYKKLSRLLAKKLWVGGGNIFLSENFSSRIHLKHQMQRMKKIPTHCGGLLGRKSSDVKTFWRLVQLIFAQSLVGCSRQVGCGSW